MVTELQWWVWLWGRDQAGFGTGLDPEYGSGGSVWGVARLEDFFGEQGPVQTGDLTIGNFSAASFIVASHLATQCMQIAEGLADKRAHYYGWVRPQRRPQLGGWLLCWLAP